jgi:hypothetical protein
VSLSSLKAFARGLPSAFSAATAGATALRRADASLRIGLAADRIVLAGSHRGVRTGQVLPVASSAEGARWQGAIDALPAALAGSAKFRATAILSNQFVRYAVLQWSPALKTAEEWVAYARHRLENVHGHAVADWDLRISETAPRGARVVSAVDRGLIEALDTAVTQAGGTLESVQPHLMSVFNRLGTLPGDGNSWLVIEETGRLTLALFLQGTWHAIRARRVSEGWREHLGDILERESAALGLERPCLDVIVCAESAFGSDRCGEFRVCDRTLPAGTSADERALAMVLR